MTRAARLLRLLPLPALLAGCVDFVDPVALKLARATGVYVTLDLAGDPFRAFCPAAEPVDPDSAVLCFSARVDPGYDRLGARLRVVDDRMVVLGVPLAPTEEAGGVLRYQGRFELSREGLESVPFTVGLPEVEDAGTLLPREIRWFAAGPVTPISVQRAPGAGVRLEVDPPAGESTPEPLNSFWSMNLSGMSTTATYNGTGLPRAAYDFPAEVLAALGNGPFGAELRWSRSRGFATPQVVLDVRFNEVLGWGVTTRAPAAGGGGG